MKKLLLLGISLVLGFSISAQTPAACSAEMWAGQHTDMGTINIYYGFDGTDSTITVEYIADAGWEITATHLYVGEINLVPNNASPGQFPVKTDPHPSGTTTVTYTLKLKDLLNGNIKRCYDIAAHADVVQPSTGRTETAWGGYNPPTQIPNLKANKWAFYFTCCRPTKTPRTPPPPNYTVKCSPDIVVSTNQGLTKTGQMVPLIRSDQNKALLLPQDDDYTHNFYTLGYGGEMILGFSNPTDIMLNVAGFDFRIVETSWSRPSCNNYPEKVDVYVSQDNITYKKVFTELCQDMEYVDIEPSDYGWIRYIKLVDATTPFGNNLTDGYDVDGIECLGQPNAKMAGPNPLDEGAFVEKLYDLYTDPATGGVTIQAIGDFFGEISFNLYNTMGQNIQSIKTEGGIEVYLSSDELQKGIYVAVIEINGITSTEKILIR